MGVRHPLIAFTGYARSGKDEAARPLIAAGYKRVAFGDIIKRQLDDIIKQHLGFSAFTEVDAEKKRIRRTLESWGEDNYERIFFEFFDTLPTPSVNTRLCRATEAREWRSRGGIVVEVRRPGVFAETDRAAAWVEELRNERLIDLTLNNAGNVAELHANVSKAFLV